jgi:peptidoglycan/LPS O-acetylase OafA/YrhL
MVLRVPQPDGGVAVTTSPGDLTLEAPDAGSSRLAHRSDVQGLRAVAVLLVVMFHMGLPLSGGFVGVDVFFVISGFVIGGMLFRQLEGGARFSFVSFYTRRMRRLLPALALLLVSVAILATACLSPLGPQQASGTTGAAAALFCANLQLGTAPFGGYFALSARTNALLHTWSLSLEEQFYLVIPAVLVAARFVLDRLRLQRSRRPVAAALLVVAIATSFALSCYASFASDTGPLPARILGRTFAFYFPMSRAWEFGVGVFVAFAAAALTIRARRFGAVLGAAGLALVAIGAVGITATTPFPGVAALVPVIGTALILVAGLASTSGVTAALAARPLVWIGDRSYSWYLWHWPLMVFAAAMWPRHHWVLGAAALAALVPACLSYRYVETPIRFDDRLTGVRIVALVIVCIAVPLAAFLGLRQVGRAQAATSAARRFVESNRPRFGVNTTTIDRAAGAIVLVGDSNAWHFSEPVGRVAQELGVGFVLSNDGGCPFADVVRESLPGVFDGEACHRFVEWSIALMKRSRPALVIVAMSSPQYMNDREDSLDLRDARSGEVGSTPEAKSRVYENGLARVLGELTDARIPVVVVHTVPQFGDLAEDWSTLSCPAVRILTNTCGTSMSRAEAEQRQARARQAEKRAAARVAGVATADFTGDLCSATTCVTDRDGRSLYRDATHLSADGALTLVGRFRALIRDHARLPSPVPPIPKPE